MYDWLFPVPTPEEINKLINGKHFMGIVEKKPTSEELIQLKKLLEEYEKK